MELDRRGAELLFQVLTEREEKASVAIASNESFSKAHMFARTCAEVRQIFASSCCPEPRCRLVGSGCAWIQRSGRFR